MGRVFGTDGVRGLANRALTPELAMDLAVAAAHVLADAGELRGNALGTPRPVAVVGRDTRASGEFLEAAVVAGLASCGLDVFRLGILPTPAIAYLTDQMNADVGVVLSASHNPMPDNGIKFFARGGHKLPDALEDQIEARLGVPWDRPTGAEVGRISDFKSGVGAYVAHLVKSTPNRLQGLRVVVDCANGAASDTTPEAMRLLGATVIQIHCSPDGLNINEGCGSTHLDDLKRAVVELKADLGIAHDGDADRCLAVDSEGNEVDGDQIMAILAVSMRDAGRLVDDTVVATVMSNLGFKLAMRDAGIEVIETGVGDRYVLEVLRAKGFNLGGEQSGHVVLTDFATTGDGGLTALALMARMADTGKSLAELATVMTRLPQALRNVKGVDKAGVAACVPLADAIEKAEAELGGRGRVLLRPSGTEPVVRVMVEAESQAEADRICDDLASVVQKELAL